MNDRNIVFGGGTHNLDFCDVISISNLFSAWKEFRKGKRAKRDIALFELSLEDNLFTLYKQLSNGQWKPDPYTRFVVRDPKPRVIHKASVRDRVLYQAVYRQLYQIFDPAFISDSYSSRLYKGTHSGVERLGLFVRKVTKNGTRQGYVLKCDARKFFDSVDHEILLSLLFRKVRDVPLRRFICQIIRSFEHTRGKGLPLGNVTSQLFANVYLNELDQFVKHGLREKWYIRYCDDFVIVGNDRACLFYLTSRIQNFLYDRLKLTLHPCKIIVRKIQSGVDFLGYVTFPHYRVLRTSTKRRMFKKLRNNPKPESVMSYLGVLSHGNTYQLQKYVTKHLPRACIEAERSIL